MVSEEQRTTAGKYRLRDEPATAPERHWWVPGQAGKYEIGGHWVYVPHAEVGKFVFVEIDFAGSLVVAMEIPLFIQRVTLTEGRL
jgi:hypothetical protein